VDLLAEGAVGGEEFNDAGQVWWLNSSVN